MIDTLSIYKRLVEAGMPKNQAEALAQIFYEIYGK